MPAPAPAAVNVTVKLKSTTPKETVNAPRDAAPDAPRFDDALRRARAKPAKAQQASEARTGGKVQRSPKASKSRSPKRADQPGEAPPVDQAGDTSEALPPPEGEEAPVEVEGDATEPAAPVAQTEPEEVDGSAAVVQLALPIEAALKQAPAEGIAEGAAEVEASGTPSVRTATQRDSAVRPSEVEVPDDADAAPAAAVVAVEADGELAAAPADSAKLNEAPKLKKAGAKAPVEQSERISSPAASKSTASRPQAPQDDQAPVVPVEPTVEAEVNVEDDEAEQATAPADAGVTAGSAESSAKPQAAMAAAPSAPADLVGAASAAPASAPHVPDTSAPDAAAPAPPTSREVEFARANHERIVTDIRAQLLPKGGAMQIRLDPPQLGALQVAVHMLDGVMSVSFETSNNEATQLLSHSLTQLKHVLESQGVSVDKLHVQQAPRSEQPSGNANDPDQQQYRDGPHDENLARQEQQRKEMLRRMWRRLALGNDPLDLVA